MLLHEQELTGRKDGPRCLAPQGRFRPSIWHPKGCPFETNSKEIFSRQKFCPPSPSPWSPSCYISRGVLSCG